MTFFATTSKRAAIFAALFLLASVPSFAQSPLYITGTDFENAFSTLTTAQNTYNDTNTVGLQALINQTGANQTWSFQSLPPFVQDTTASTPITIVPISSRSFPEADSFPTATHVETFTSGSTNLYFFVRIDPSGFYSLGISGDSLGFNPRVLQTYSPPEENFAFPLTYQTQWSSTSVINAPPSSQTEEIVGLVDGWGTYSIPGNNSIQALRIRTETIDNYPLTIYSSPNGNDTVPAYSDTSYSFEWFNLSNFSAEIDAGANQIATRASYAVPGAQNIVLNNPPTSQYSISVASNPVSSPTSVSFTLPSEASVRISLMDALGKQSQILMNGMAHAGVNTLPLDPANLMNGAYFLRVESAGNSSMQKVIVNH
jgi:Secretion system C-terminal sorting domain